MSATVSRISHWSVLEHHLEALLKDLQYFANELSNKRDVHSLYAGLVTDGTGAPIEQPHNVTWKNVEPDRWFGENKRKDGTKESVYSMLRQFEQVDVGSELRSALGIKSKNYQPNVQQLTEGRTRMLALYDDLMNLEFGEDENAALIAATKAALEESLEGDVLPDIEAAMGDSGSSRTYGFMLMKANAHAEMLEMQSAEASKVRFAALESLSDRRADILRTGMSQEQVWIALEDHRIKVALQTVEFYMEHMQKRVKYSDAVAADAAALALKHAAAGIELTFREKTWPMEIRQSMMEAIASVGSGVPVRRGNETVMANVLSGALTGMGVGASVAKNNPNAGAGWGALIGGVSALLGGT